VFCPKYRIKVINSKVEETIKQTVSKICENYGFSLIQMEIMPVHLHIFLSAPPTVAPTKKAKQKASGQNPGSLENWAFFGVGGGTCVKNLTTEMDVY